MIYKDDLFVYTENNYPGPSGASHALCGVSRVLVFARFLSFSQLQSPSAHQECILLFINLLLAAAAKQHRQSRLCLTLLMQLLLSDVTLETPRRAKSAHILSFNMCSVTGGAGNRINFSTSQQSCTKCAFRFPTKRR